SPSLRGVPSSVNYGTTQHHTSTTSNTTVSARPAQVQHNPHPPQQSPNPPPIPSNPPPESTEFAETLKECNQSLCDVLEELENTPGRFKGPGDLIAEKLERIRADDGEVNRIPVQPSKQHTEQRTTTGPGGAPAAAAKPLESRGHGSLNNPGGRIPYCESCKQQIRGAFVLATGLAWCPEHFVCAYRGCGRTSSGMFREES
ncbi:hypothetical protein COOONC_20616, partial [Cooperia oncophora]